MSTPWAGIAAVVLALAIWGAVSSAISSRRERKARARALPFVGESIRVGQRYDVQLSDGTRFVRVEFLGMTDPRDGQFPLGGREGLLVLSREDGKKTFVRPTSIRSVKES